MKNWILIILCSWAVQQAVAQNTGFIKYNHPYLQYQGRVNMSGDQAAEIYWSGSSVELDFEGTGVSTKLKDASGINYFLVVLDGKPTVKVHPTKIEQTFVLASNLTAGKHNLQLFKCTEGSMGKTWFYGFLLKDGGKVLQPEPIPERKIEFYGSSVNSGFSIEAPAGKDSDDSRFENNYYAYPAIVSRYFKSNYSCISESGVGIVLSWTPVILPEVYDRLDPGDGNSKWTFEKYQPDVVVLNICENDAYLVQHPEVSTYKKRYPSKGPDDTYIIAAYTRFFQQIRAKYPNAQIICALGPLSTSDPSSSWPYYIKRVISNLGDKKIYSFVFEHLAVHPRKAEQQAMANTLIANIKQHTNW